MSEQKTVTRRVKKHYVNNPDFLEALVAYRLKVSESKKPVPIPNYIGECIQQICKKLATKPNFVGYTYKEEMIGDGIENCIAAIMGFDPEKSSNPFAYYTQIAWNAFIRRIGKEHKQTYLKYKNMQNLYLTGEYGDVQTPNDEISNVIIENFEKKLTKSSKSSIIGIEKFADVVILEENEECELF